MNTQGVILDEATLDKLTAATNGVPVPVLKPTGEVAGYYLTPTQLTKFESEHATVVSWMDKLWPPERIAKAIERSKQDTGPKRTMEDVFRLFEGR